MRIHLAQKIHAHDLKNGPLYAMMATLALGTIMFGLGLVNPFTDTFHAGVSWRALDGIRWGFVQPDETIWGMIFFGVGLNMLAKLRVFHVSRLASPSPLRVLGLGNSRFAFVLAAVLWIGVGSSWWISNPASVGAYLVLCLPVVQSIYIAIFIGRVIRDQEGDGGP